MPAPHLPTDPVVQTSLGTFPKEQVTQPSGDVSMNKRAFGTNSSESQQDLPGYTARGDATKEANLDKSTDRQTQIKDLLKLIDGMETAMLVTRNSDGSLVSRAMQTRKHQSTTALYFITNNQSHKLDDLENDNQVNLSYLRGPEWVSVSGIAKVTRDQAKINELWGKDIRAWFGDLKDGVHDGSANDPRISIIEVEPQSVHYQMRDKTTPSTLFQIAKGVVTGEPPKVGPARELGKQDLQAGA